MNHTILRCAAMQSRLTYHWKLLCHLPVRRRPGLPQNRENGVSNALIPCVLTTRVFPKDITSSGIILCVCAPFAGKACRQQRTKSNEDLDGKDDCILCDSQNLSASSFVRHARGCLERNKATPLHQQNKVECRRKELLDEAAQLLEQDQHGPFPSSNTRKRPHLTSRDAISPQKKRKLDDDDDSARAGEDCCRDNDCAHDRGDDVRVSDSRDYSGSRGGTTDGHDAVDFQSSGSAGGCTGTNEGTIDP